MKIISPSFEILTPLDGKTILKHIELCGRVCYKSEDKITDTSAAAFVAGIIKRGHEAVLEHFNITIKFICCLLYTSPSPRDMRRSRMPSSA